MSGIKFISFCKLIFFIMFALSLSSCLKDAECHFSYRVHIKINDKPGSVDSVSLYVFTENDLLKEILDVPVDQTSSEVCIPLNHLQAGKYTFVAWGNLSDKQLRPDNTPEQFLLEEATVCLRRSEDGVTQSPNDLFYGRLSATIDKTTNYEDEIIISRTVGGVVIKAYNLMSYYGKEDTCFSIQLNGSRSELPFVHELTNGSNYLPPSEILPCYKPGCSWGEEYNLLQSEAFLVLPSAVPANLSVDIFYKGEKLNTYELKNSVKANKVAEITLNFWNQEPDKWFNILDWSIIFQEPNF